MIFHNRNSTNNFQLMNIEINQENSEIVSIGTRLRQAREALKLSQEAVAERLCLMLSTVREIEEDKISPKLAPTFSRGYVRSYAKLVQIPEEELLAMMPEGDASVVSRNTAPMHSFSYAKKRKKRDSWLMFITLIILFTVVGLTGAWWWDNYQAQQREIEALIKAPATSQPIERQVKRAKSTAATEQKLILPTEQHVTAADKQGIQQQELAVLPQEAGIAENPAKIPQSIQSVPAANSATSAMPGTNSATTSGTMPGKPLQGQSASGASTATASTSTAAIAPAEGQLQISPADALQAAANQAYQQAQNQNSVQNQNAQNTAQNSSTGLLINFIADCWIEVHDVTGKNLASTLQRKGSLLELEGEPPYKIKLGVPSAVQITYQGSIVDLGDLARLNRVVRLTIPLQ